MLSGTPPTLPIVLCIDCSQLWEDHKDLLGQPFIFQCLLSTESVLGAGNKSVNKIKAKNLYCHGTSIPAFESFALGCASLAEELMVVELEH